MSDNNSYDVIPFDLRENYPLFDNSEDVVGNLQESFIYGSNDFHIM